MSPSEADGEANCQECRRKISSEATSCPECGYSPRDFLPICLGIGGATMSATIIGAIVGLPVIVYAVILYTRRGNAKPSDEGFWYREEAILQGPR